MSKLLLNLRQVPEDEAADVRALLDAHRIEFYETRPSRWGISYGGIWIAYDRDEAAARALMAEYQGERQARARAEHDAALRDGSAETFVDVLRREPLRVLAIVAAIVALLAVLALPAWLLRH
ncbi:hypothetical protein ASD78_11440 [Lysobacter sp. Root667]|uniref:DUF6164 family protein n=1 Tax=Lysobacter sp. Root667 TaxID=1736581 RepID=UPI0006FD0AB1|nr:DUF6164 family protein [Lysobacter sp. Root667]KRA74116.1 hypothetical protein ASD78_11440 [Lysobacter sp. Root667]